MRCTQMYKAIALTTALAISASAADLVIDGEASSANVTTSLLADMPSSLIGDWDPKTNPTGTRTLPGLFGGEGNQAIGLDIDASVNSTITAPPGGTLGFNPDFESLTLSVDDLFLDVLGEEPGALTIGVQLTFGTFRSFSPDSLFPGGSYPFDAAEGSITLFTATQSGPSFGGVLIPDGKNPNLYTFIVNVPVTIAVQANVLDQIVDPGPTEAVLPMTGSILIDGTTITVTQTVDAIIDEVIVDPPNSDFTDIPFDIPTILPPGDFAHVLLSGTVASIDFDAVLDLDLVATGELDATLPGDINGDGTVDVEDLLLLLAAWGDCTDCPEDLDGSGAVDVDDLLILLANWS